MFDFGLRIRELREQHHLSQEELGLRVGRSKSVIRSYENNIKLPPLDVLTDMALVFHVSLDYLVGIDKEEMLSIQALSEQQKKILRTLVAEFQDTSPKYAGLSDRQIFLLDSLLKEFATP